MRIYHPFDPFIPVACRYLLLGSFPGKLSTSGEKISDDWYYGARGNQFWPIMRLLFPRRELTTVNQKMELFSDLHMAVTDIVLSCERRKNSNLDSNLSGKEYNLVTVGDILGENPVRTVFFTGIGVMREFLNNFACRPNVMLEPLPSPSPAFFRMSVAEKAYLYHKLLVYHGAVLAG